MQELLFLGGFIIFIVAILLVDMLAIDRKAHVVSIKEAGTWTRSTFTLLATSMPSQLPTT